MSFSIVDGSNAISSGALIASNLSILTPSTLSNISVYRSSNVLNVNANYTFLFTLPIDVVPGSVI